MPAKLAQPPRPCRTPNGSLKITHANSVATTGCNNRVTDENEAGRCASPYATNPCPPTWLISASAISTTQPSACLATRLSLDSNVTNNNAGLVTRPDHAMIVAVENE